MPITNSPTATTSMGAMPNFGGMPGMSLNLPMFQGQTSGQNLGGLPVGFDSIRSLLTQQPQSMTNSLIPGLSQILGLQTSSMMPFFQNQTMGNVSAAQSDAMRRGMTGSSIEAASMLGARQAGDYNMNQFMGQQLGQLGSSYQGAIGTDVNNQNQMYQNLAQAIGQQMQSFMEQQMFQQMMSQQSDIAAQSGRNAMWGAGIQAAGNLGGSAIGKYSDDILKTNVKKVDEIKGVGLYEFEYRQDLNMKLPEGRQLGFLAQEVAKKFPQFVSKIRGFLAVDYIGLANALEA